MDKIIPDGENSLETMDTSLWFYFSGDEYGNNGENLHSLGAFYEDMDIEEIYTNQKKNTTI